MGSDSPHGYIGFRSAYAVTSGDVNPKVLELEANDRVGDTVIFHVTEANAHMGQFINNTAEGKSIKKPGQD